MPSRVRQALGGLFEYFSPRLQRGVFGRQGDLAGHLRHLLMEATAEALVGRADGPKGMRILGIPAFTDAPGEVLDLGGEVEKAKRSICAIGHGSSVLMDSPGEARPLSVSLLPHSTIVRQNKNAQKLLVLGIVKEK